MNKIIIKTDNLNDDEQLKLLMLLFNFANDDLDDETNLIISMIQK